LPRLNRAFLNPNADKRRGLRRFHLFIDAWTARS
jgi:hypothetical protein